jgi:hypothetical protein
MLHRISDAEPSPEHAAQAAIIFWIGWGILILIALIMTPISIYNIVRNCVSLIIAKDENIRSTKLLHCLAVLALVLSASMMIPTSLFSRQTRFSQLRHSIQTFVHPVDDDVGHQNNSLMPKLAVVNKTQIALSFFQHDLPDSWAARDPDEVATVVWIECGRRPKPQYKYSSGKPAFIKTCRVSVIDWKNRRLMFSRDFEGGEPPRTVPLNASDEKRTGSAPDREIREFLRALCKQETGNK